MTEINFYQTDEAVAKSVAPLLLKVLEEKKKALVFCANQIQVKEIDAGLWTYGRSTFIPHITDSDKDFELKRQPIFITDKEENLNDADYLIFLAEPSKAFVSGFKRVFYFFEEGKKSAKLKPTNFYKKECGKWVKGK